MSITYKYLNFRLRTNLLNECKKLVYYNYADRDLKDAITACAIKSPDGMPNNMFKVDPDICDRYIFTSIVSTIPNVMEEINKFRCSTARIRILKQEPQDITPVHIDEENWHNPVEKHLRIWIAINHNPNFICIFGKDEICLEAGQGVVFNPDTPHGAKNLDKSEARYSLNMIVKPNKWLKENVIEH
tara:strand:+ start:8502 stop:9059 length:558 start_codon:yes stop_codon:yes gene_type:complete